MDWHDTCFSVLKLFHAAVHWFFNIHIYNTHLQNILQVMVQIINRVIKVYTALSLEVIRIIIAKY